MFDLAIIGGGPGGYTAAAKAIKNNLSVILFEQDTLGGTCLNVGCIPTKALLYSSKLYRHAKESEKFGICVNNATFDFLKIQQRKMRVVRRLVAGVKQQTAGAAIVNKTVRIAAYSNGVTTLVADGETYEAKNVIIATGSVNALPPLKGIDLPHVVDSTGALALAQPPRKAVIVGGGVIGIEFAQMWNNFGSEVTVVEMLPSILANLDRDLSSYAAQSLTKQGVRILTETRVESITAEAVITDKGAIEADTVLVCTGRRPNMTGIESLNLPLEAKGIKVDEHMQTCLRGIYAVGDVTAKSMLAHTAERQAVVAVNNILGISDSMTYNAIPAVVYTDPEIACVGLTEREAENLLGEGNYHVTSLPMLFAGRFVAENDGEQGLCKIITGNDGHIIGVHIAGNASSEIISVAAMAIEQHMTTQQFEKIIFPHPTVSEIIKIASNK